MVKHSSPAITFRSPTVVMLSKRRCFISLLLTTCVSFFIDRYHVYDEQLFRQLTKTQQSQVIDNYSKQISMLQEAEAEKELEKNNAAGGNEEENGSELKVATELRPGEWRSRSDIIDSVFMKDDANNSCRVS